MMIPCNLAYSLVVFMVSVSFDHFLCSFLRNLVALDISEILFDSLALDFVILFGHFDFLSPMKLFVTLFVPKRVLIVFNRLGDRGYKLTIVLG